MIRIEHLRKEYANATPLQDVNVTINDGDVISVIGPSGTGKSTFIRCLNLLETPTSGNIWVDGVCITDKKCDINKVRQKMGMVFQSFNLFNHMNVIGNIIAAPVDLLKIPKAEAYEEGMRLLRTVGLADKAQNFPEELSGGQKQRVAIARTLAMKPNIILFDEPTSALDPTMVGEVQAVIRDLASQGLTMIIVTHEMRFAREIANRVFFMDEGGIYEEGTPDEIFQNPKREKTIAFIRHINTFTTEILSRDFDFIGLNTGLEEFGRRNGMSQKAIYRLQSVFEELGVQIILSALGENVKMNLSVDYSQTEERATMRIKYGGDPFDPKDSDNILSLKLAENASESIVYERLAPAADEALTTAAKTPAAEALTTAPAPAETSAAEIPFTNLVTITIK